MSRWTILIIILTVRLSSTYSTLSWTAGCSSLVSHTTSHGATTIAAPKLYDPERPGSS
ncbi:hypothetical protein FA15DRAFT_665938 [Coprinopsis marcescibilis]|uniref:Uncharacterized protein n=1 Tax=Coprinopsis marcescibilis TaxID=230819 RepID=A0A5C3L5A6_COPMA|nr:hypothetical protein FA15DRAFT_665938 [Coprinopsis marcescibilis]